MASVDGLSLEFSDNRAVPDTLDAINDELHTIGAGVWPLDLHDRPADIRALLAKPVLDTFVANLGHHYPQLHQVQKGVDYTRFDRFHVNAGPDGSGVDEVLQMLSGSGFVVHQRSTARTC